MKQSNKAAPMASAPFVYGQNGEVLWDKMWDQFCMLAKEGGPPHRDQLLQSRGETNDTSALAYTNAVKEIIRAYKILTPYKVQHVESGWIEVRLNSKNMAQWFFELIVMENVECRRVGKCIYLPVNDDFTLEKEIKNVVTVLAKAHHYWTQHRNWFTKLVIHLTAKDIQSVNY
jgi:sirohydrochlorin cobaltochelatase